MRRKIKHFWREFAKRGNYVIAILLISVSVLFLWSIVTGFSQSLALITIGIAALSALFAAISSIAGLMQATEVQRQRENQERPYVIVSFDGTSQGFEFLEIQNAGNSPAVDVVLTFDPAPVDFAGRKLNEVSLFKKPISFMPQGKMYRQFIEASHKFLADGKPTKYRIKLIYNSVSGQYFEETIDFDLEYSKQATLPRKSTEENLEEISKQLKDITKILESVRGMNSFLVDTPENYIARIQAIKDKREELPSWKAFIRKLLELGMEKVEK